MHLSQSLTSALLSSFLASIVNAYPTNVHINYAQSTYVNPSYAHPTYAQSTYINPSYAHPTYAQSTYINPSYAHPTYAQSTYVNPSYAYPSYAQPTYIQSSYAHPVPSAALHRRSIDLNLQLLGDAGVCGNFEFDNGNTFKALCVGDTGNPVSSSVNMDQCILNQGGNMAFLFNGGFSGSCNECTLDDSLNLTCNCQTGAPNEFIKSTINIDGTSSDDGSGAFVMDNGHLACRAPTG